MSHSIKVSDKVYKTIKRYMGAQESYSHVIERAFSVFETISEVSETLGPSHHLAERPKEQEVKRL